MMCPVCRSDSHVSHCEKTVTHWWVTHWEMFIFETLSSCHSHVRINWGLQFFTNFYIFLLEERRKPRKTSPTAHEQDWKNWQSPLSFFGTSVVFYRFLMPMQQCQCGFVYIYIIVYFVWLFCVPVFLGTSMPRRTICMGYPMSLHYLSPLGT